MDTLFNWQLICASPPVDQLSTWDPHIYWVGQVVYPTVVLYNWCIWALETCVVVLLPELNSVASWDGLTALLAFNVIYWLALVLGYEDASRVTPAGIWRKFSPHYKSKWTMIWSKKLMWSAKHYNLVLRLFSTFQGAILKKVTEKSLETNSGASRHITEVGHITIYTIEYRFFNSMF